ncbi:hypothetical protein Taro_017942 [Colocasia esculenta]|uniref:Pentatricopeptide repeat-containing protein n=1 Tax=Colocasia esculenta TaxID=4460 RepID=A0A843UUS7_COLES|nr:hypothetical protein [Colocasia esculenta]
MLRGTPKLLLRRLCASAAAGSSPKSPLSFCSTTQTPAKPFTTALDPKRPRNALLHDSSSRHEGRSSSCRAITPDPLLRCDNPNRLTPPSSVHLEAESICYLLSEPSNQTQPVDVLLRDRRDKLSSELVLHVLCSYRKLGRERTLQFFSWAGSHLCFRLDDAVVEYMADFLGRRKLFDDLKCLLRTVRSGKGSVSPRAISICIRFLGRQGRVAEAMSLFEAVEVELNCTPDNLVFNNVLYMLCKMSLTDDSIEVALAVFRRIRRPDEYSYSNLLVGLCRSGRLEHALKIFDEMVKSGFAPTRSAANLLIGELCELGVKNEAVEKVPVRGVRRPFDILVPNAEAKTGMKPVVEVLWTVWKLGLLPSPFVVDRLILELCHLGKIEEAVAILKAVGDKKPRSFQESYITTIKALCRVRQMDGACELFEKMVSLGLKPKVTVYNSIIQVFCKLGNLEGAEKFFKIMNRMRCEPDSATYTVLIHAYCGMQSWEAAYELLLEMIGLGLRPHFGTYNLVDNFLKGNGRTDLSVKLEAKTEALILLRHCKTGKLEAAYETLSTMIEKGVHPPMYIIERVKHAFRGSSKCKMVKQLLDRTVQVSS